MELQNLLFLLVINLWAPLHAQLLINEVLPSNNRMNTSGEGHSPDQIELFNPGNAVIDLVDWRVGIGDQVHVIDGSLTIAPRAHLLLFCDGHPERGPDHLGFKLNKRGGAIMLIAPDGSSIADLFSYPACPAGVSVGRFPDGARSWSYFTTPSLGMNNVLASGRNVRSHCATPVIEVVDHGENSSLQITAGDSADVRFTIDGSEASITNGLRYVAPFALQTSTVVRARAFASGSLASAEAMLTFDPRSSTHEMISLALSPEDLFGDSVGIYHPGLFNNNTRRGKEWERSGLMQFDRSTTAQVGLRIAGSGSRSAGKRSFKVFARDDDALLIATDGIGGELMLRADASPHAFLRNVAIEELVRRYHLNLTVQPSVARPLYLNGAYWGLYRVMPAKSAAWLKQQCNAEAVDVIEGPAATERSGKNDTYLRALGLLAGRSSIDSIEALLDINSLIDLACVDLWTGRADHDLNVRCYRPRERDGRWRWVLFDMDLWSLPEENSTERMCSAATMETPFIPQLMQHAQLQERLLARMVALQACAFTSIDAIADSIQWAHGTELNANYKRWELQLEMPSPEASLAEVKNFSVARPEHLFRHLAQRTGRKLRTVSIEAPSANEGRLLLNGLELSPGLHHVRCFSGIPLHLEAIPASGHEFANWKGVEARASSIALDPSNARHLSVQFREVLP